MPRRRIKTSRKKSGFRLKPIYLLILGLVFLAFPKAYQYVSNHPAGLARQLSPTVQKVASNSADTGPIQIDPTLLGGQEATQPPERIVIPTLSIDLSVVEANVVNGYWELSETTASHGVGSANPGENGNIIVFAHAREGLFMPLRNIKTGDTVYILTKDRWHRYSVSQTQEVAPTETQVISPTTSETLTLYTCSGFLDSKRLIVTAKPQK